MNLFNPESLYTPGVIVTDYLRDNMLYMPNRIDIREATVQELTQLKSRFFKYAAHQQIKFALVIFIAFVPTSRLRLHHEYHLPGPKLLFLSH
jgi:hypothetical protein